MDMVKFAAGAALALMAAPALAETPAELDALARASMSPTAGIALARTQIAAGTLLDALGTLERVMMNAPKSNEARLLHAGVLCRLDDRRGAMIELDQLRDRQMPAALWTEANAACSIPEER